MARRPGAATSPSTAIEHVLSVALVPIRAQEKIVGLVQLNHRRLGRFSTQTVAALEDVASHIVVVFRAVRELLMNVLKHAGTLEAKVSIHQTRESLEVVVSDEGKGFEADALSSVPRGSFGLFSLREQMSRIGVSVELTSSKGHGTQARVRVTL